MRRLLFALALASGGAMACDRVSVTTTHDVPIGAAKRVEVYTDGGDVALVAGDADWAYVDAERTAYDEDEARGLRVKVAVEGDALQVRWEGKSNHGRSVSFRVQVPPGLPAAIRTDGGDISVSSMRGGLDASTDGGNISCQDGEGLMFARTDGGNIRVRRHIGTVDLRTDGGDISVSGALRGANSAETDGGDVDFSIPERSRLFVFAKSDGSVSNEFGLPTSGESFEGAIGDGAEGSLSLITDGGRIRLHRASN